MEVIAHVWYRSQCITFSSSIHVAKKVAGLIPGNILATKKHMPTRLRHATRMVFCSDNRYRMCASQKYFRSFRLEVLEKHNWTERSIEKTSNIKRHRVWCVGFLFLFPLRSSRTRTPYLFPTAFLKLEAFVQMPQLRAIKQSSSQTLGRYIARCS